MTEKDYELWKQDVEFIGILREENEKLKADYGTKAQVERDLLKEENNKLKSANEFLKTNRRTPNKEEILAYEYGRREVLRINKEK